METQIISKNFSKKSYFYDSNAILQKDCANKLIYFTEKFINPNSKILDLGSGSSFIAKNLHNNNLFKGNIFEVDITPNMLKTWNQRPKNAFPILADISNLPIKNKELFDIIFSSFALQWIKDYDKFLLKFSKILKKNGILAIALPIKKSLEEIRLSSVKSGCNFNFIDLPESELVIKKLKKYGFQNKFTYYETIEKSYQNATYVLKNIKNIGANYSKKIHFINKKKLQKFNDFFSLNFNNKTSWNIAYFIFTK